VIDIYGALLLFVLPGLFVTLIFFKSEQILLKIVYTVFFSILIAVFVGMFLGYNETMKDLTGGITRHNLIMYLTVISGILFLIFLAKTIKEQKTFKHRMPAETGEHPDAAAKTKEAKKPAKVPRSTKKKGHKNL
jgi:prepilin signal peptidase PulO-like enzyme (type II secretory pathway)